MAKLNRTDAEWRAKLTPEQYRILREGGTEPPWSGKLPDATDQSEFRCAGCGAALFAGDSKFESGSGWPSFTRPVDGEAVSELVDSSHGMVRTEVRCASCEGHLGHVFPDGPGPEGLRYCINAASLELRDSDSDDGPA